MNNYNLQIQFIQQRIKFLLYLKRNYKIKYNKIKHIIYNLSNIITNNYNKELITQYNYNNNLNVLEEITNNFLLLNNTCEIINVVKNTTKLNKIVEILKTSINECGISNLCDLLFLLNERIENEELLCFINNSFNITQVNINNCNKLNKSSKKITIYQNNEENTILNYDLQHISQLKDYLFTKNFKKNLSFLENVNGCRIYIRCKNKKNILILSGYFNNDQLNIYRNYDLFKPKRIQLLNDLTNLNINNKFKKSYLKQLSLKNFIILSIKEIIDKLKNDYFEIINYKNKSLSNLVKDFLNKNINDQINFISMFLLFEEDSEIQNMAYLLYDMICNESYLLKPSADSNIIFTNIHWSLQKEFKIINKKYDTDIKKIESFTLEDISYDKRIYLMKANNSVKQKAYNKLKEISNKSNDNSSKAIQYLDNLLKVPFGIYQKEDILIYYDRFSINYLFDLKKYLKNNNTSDTKVNYLKELSKKNNIYYDEILLANKYILDIENIDKNINHINKNSILKKKKNELEKITKSLLNDIKISQQKLNYPLIKLKKKSDFVENINNIFNANKNEEINNKYLKLLSDEDLSNKYLNNSYNNLIVNFNKYNSDVSDYLQKSSNILDNAIYGQNEAKIEIKRIISQWINGENSGYCLGFEGPPGTGKTTIAKEGISNCLRDINNNNPRPFSFIALGGSTNGSTFEGHNYTYLGSTHGKIVDILIESKCMNPIIYIDELDKISNTENGKELIGILTHLTDSTQNEQFNDKYFSGIDFDLSKVLFIFSYNDYNKIDTILADRIHRIKFNYISTDEKIIIMKKYIIPKLMKTVGIKELIVFEDYIIEYIVQTYTIEGGVRKLKEKVFEIIRQINLNLLNSNNYLEHLENKNIYKDNKIYLNIQLVNEILENKPKLTQKKINEYDKIGLVNGLYATSCGTGGITIIEAKKTFHETKLALVITGQQGDVMKESIQCAKTIAWNLIPNKIKQNIHKNLKDNCFGIHIHCPEAATPKDGPSAGTAITLTILSLLTELNVKHNVALTGEINLNGEVLPVGGIDLKIEGGKNAGVKKILLPFENKEEFDIIKKNKPHIDDGVHIYFIKTIWDIFEHVFDDNSINFNFF